MKKVFALILALMLVLSLAGCAGNAADDQTVVAETAELGSHKIGVIVYDIGNEEVIGIREYLQGYIAENFEGVEFVYSDSITSEDEEMTFIQQAIESGVEGFMSFNSYDLAAEVQLCADSGVYYMMASGTVSDEEFASVSDNDFFLGVFGPGKEAEYQAGADMAKHFCEEHEAKTFFILSGGASMGNEMHLQRTLGILDTLCSELDVKIAEDLSSLAAVSAPTKAVSGDVTVVVCPGYLDFEDFLTPAVAAYQAGNFDVVLSVLPPAEFVNSLSGSELGIIDSYNTRNLQLVSDGTLDYICGKYSSVVGPAFALMYNAVTGYADDYRDNGLAVQITQDLWVSGDPDDFMEKYTLSSSAVRNAYNFEDLSAVCKVYNPDADLQQLKELSKASSYDEVLARRSNE